MTKSLRANPSARRGAVGVTAVTARSWDTGTGNLSQAVWGVQTRDTDKETGPGMEEAVHLDFETGSPTDLKKSGVYRYAEDKDTQVWGFRYQFNGDEDIYEWRPGWPDPVVLLQHIRDGKKFVAHKADFERTLWNWVLVPRLCPHWPMVTIQQQDCTMARAAAVSHPQGLEQLGDALDTHFRKDTEGSKAMKKMAKPRRLNADGTYSWWHEEQPELYETNMEYCGRDVQVEAEADTMLPALTARERQVWELDQTINERGIPIDMHFARRAVELVAYSKKRNDSTMRSITKHTVGKCSQDAKIVAWLNSRGIKCTSLAKGEVDDVLFMAEAAMDDDAVKAIKLRQASWKTSTAKYTAMDGCVNADDRIRGTLNYHGAGPGRWAGRLIQPQNFKRVDADDEFLQIKIKWLHDLVGDTSLSIREVYEHLACVHGDLEPLDLLSNALRSAIKAPEGKKFVSGDFSNIEGRFNAWLAGEQWKLDAFRAYDDKVGPDLYKLAYSRSFGVPIEEVGKGQKRQIGKVQELALGYQGGVGAYLDMGATYGVNPYDLSGPVYEATQAYQWDSTERRYHSPGTNRQGLEAKEWTALQILVDNWRAANPAIVQSWWNYQDAAVAAVATPGYVVHPDHTTKVGYYCDGRALWAILPSGRTLCYASPYIESETFNYTDKVTGAAKQSTKRVVYFSGVDSTTRQWVVKSLYGGLQCENFVQAGSRDVMVDAMFRAEEAGYPLILTVHDELLAEVDELSNLNEHHFEQVMSIKNKEYEGLPVSVGAWEDKRYVK